jgi:hypothetical protein
MFELCLSQPTRAPACPAPPTFRPQFTSAYSMLLCKVVIGSRAFSNGDASREKTGIEIKQTPGLQGVGAKIKKCAAFGRVANSVSFCARNKIIASTGIVNNPADNSCPRRKENGRSDRI